MLNNDLQVGYCRRVLDCLGEAEAQRPPATFLVQGGGAAFVDLDR